MSAPTRPRAAEEVWLPQDGILQEYKDVVRRMLTHRIVRINDIWCEWGWRELYKEDESSGETFTTYALQARKIERGSESLDPMAVYDKFRTHRKESGWLFPARCVEAAFRWDMPPRWLRAQRTFRLLFDQTGFHKKAEVDADFAIAYAIAKRRELLDHRRTRKDDPVEVCGLEEIAELATSFVASVGDTILDLRSVLKDKGDRDTTDEKVIQAFFTKRQFEESEIDKRSQRYMESCEVDGDRRVAAAYGARMLFEKYPELSKDVFRDIQCMSMNISTSIATELEEIIDSTVSNYLANSLSQESILRMDPSKLANPRMAEIIQVRGDQLRRREERKRRGRRRAKRAMQPPASSASEENPSSLSPEAISMSIRTKATSTSTGV
ncbi:hypothetical protein HD553DRAFT_337971 [Filobasidium floriforme]|uniref:uncharacterized protein n=1 Tax=Filobasidium floriforme TaxID=5210 RepID=UPI001E8D991F|nr:uncharacterized protein HD553DRAFT_337971 [Filobasidium floriforme]KAH8090284.1 hypothetical protein HD553DRAFT_337971 [Filobasidium floriforme]